MESAASTAQTATLDAVGVASQREYSFVNTQSFDLRETTWSLCPRPNNHHTHTFPLCYSYYSYCPCFALCNAANDAKLNNGDLYCIMTTCGCGCCALMMLGQDIEEKRGLRKHDGCWHCMHTCFNGCTCHSCRVVNECKVYAKDGAVNAAPTGTQMTR